MRRRGPRLKVTIHTGEDTPASFVIDTIRLANPDRIGHGIHILEDPAAVDLVRERGLTLEVQPLEQLPDQFSLRAHRGPSSQEAV